MFLVRQVASDYPDFEPANPRTREPANRLIMHP